MTELPILAQGDGYTFALWRNLFLLDFRSTPLVEALEMSVKAKKLARDQWRAGGFAVLNFLAPGPLPAAEVREVAAKVQHEDTADTLCHATVVEATGFSGSAFRSVLTGLNAFQRQSFPRKVFGSADEAIEWQAQTCKLDRDWLLGARRAVGQLRALR